METKKEIIIRCPICGSNHISRTSIKINNNGTWVILMIFILLGGTIHPLVWILLIIEGILIFIINIIRKHKYKYHWLIQCNRCSEIFSIPDPRYESYVSNNQKKLKQKQIKTQTTKKEKSEKRREILINGLRENGALEENEILLLEKSFFRYRINPFISINGKLRITDKTIIWYNPR